jgi:ribosomal protein L16/L10AE
LNKTLTKLPLESRMGKGKGSIYTKVVFLKKGFVLYEFQNIKNQSMKELFYFFRKYFPAKLLLINKK